MNSIYESIYELIETQVGYRRLLQTKKEDTCPVRWTNTPSQSQPTDEDDQPLINLNGPQLMLKKEGK